MISGKEISISKILKNVTFEIKKGRITTFIGHSGAGKTSLLKCSSNLLRHYSGIILYREKNIKDLNPKERASAVGYVAQQFHLFPHLTVLQNCTYALVSTGFPDAVERARQTLQMLNLDSYRNSYPKHLSGGQQQRVAIARALVLQPEVLLLDEPTSALDPENSKCLEKILLELNAKGVTLALSSHDMSFVRNIQDCIYFMESGQIVETWNRNDRSLDEVKKIKSFLTT